MASKAPPETADICPVCFETRPLKIAGRCKHSICTECLIIALGHGHGDMFSCPTCQADCPRPWNGVEGLVDFTGEEIAVEDLGSLVEQGRKVEGKDDKETVPKQVHEKIKPEDVDSKCLICRHRKKEVPAVNLCAECNNLHICQDCTHAHARNKATQGHVVISLRPERRQPEAMCKKHDSALDSYCQECEQAVCVVCIMLEHGDHTMEKLGDMVDAKVKALKVILEDREKRLKKLQELREELTLLTRMAPVVDKQDVLTKEIEDHAQNCHEKIIKWKENLKAQVKANYQIIRDVPECLKKVSEEVKKLQAPIQRAGGLLTEPEHQPVYLDRLMSLQKDFEALAETEDNMQGTGLMEEVQKLHNDYCSFSPVEIDSIFGQIDKSQAKKGEFEPKEIFTLTMPTDSNEHFIPCVANLGQTFAVAHLTKEGEPSNAIDVYKFSGNLQHTFKDHVPPLYDMSATPDGKLAVLSDGTGGTSHCVKLFDSEKGYISSTRDFDIAKPLSLGVTLHHQYVILGDNEQGERQITVVDKDGHVEHTHVIQEKIKGKRINPSRITCGGRFIFVIGKLGAFAYEIKETGIHDFRMCFSFTEPDNTHRVDISANVWDDIYFSHIFEKIPRLGKYVKDKPFQSKWTNMNEHNFGREVTGADRKTSVSRRGSFIVMSHGQTIIVLKEK